MFAFFIACFFFLLFREPSADRNLNASLDVEDANENFSKSSIKQSNSFGNLTDSSRNVDHAFNMDNTTMRRNRSFWRFSKSEDILEGMALWKHRDLMPIDAENADKEMTLKKQMKPTNKKVETLHREKTSANALNTKLDANKRNLDPRERAKSMTKESKNEFMHQDDDIYDESPKKRNDLGPSSKSQSKNSKSKIYSDSYQDTNFYDDDDMMVIKTVKRKEILKQYYSSGTDTELSSSDPYDCIVVDDHLVPSTSNNYRNRNSYAAEPEKRGTFSRSNKSEVSGTLLPRTKLSRPSRGGDSEEFDTMERKHTAKSNKASNRNSSFGAWSNMWPDEKTFH